MEFEYAGDRIKLIVIDLRIIPQKQHIFQVIDSHGVQQNFQDSEQHFPNF